MSARALTIGSVATILVLALVAAYLWLFEIDAVVGPPSTTIDVRTLHVQIVPRRTASALPWLRPNQVQVTDATGETLWRARIGEVDPWLGGWPLSGDGQTLLVADDHGLHAFDLHDGRLLFERGTSASLAIDGLYDLGDLLLLREDGVTRCIVRESGDVRWEVRAADLPPRQGQLATTGAFGTAEVEIEGAYFDRATGAPREPAAALSTCRAGERVVWVDAARGLLRRASGEESRVIVALPLWERVQCVAAIGDRTVVLAWRLPVSSAVEQESWRAVPSASFGPVAVEALGAAHREVVLVIEPDDRISSVIALEGVVGWGSDPGEPAEVRIDVEPTRGDALTAHLDVAQGTATLRREAATGTRLPD